MGFGLCNVPATFSPGYGFGFNGFVLLAGTPYLDDIVIIGRTFDEHLLNVTEVLERFRLHNLKLKKFNVFQTEIDFQGHHVSSEGVAIQVASKLQTVVNWPIPKDKNEGASFLGTVNYHREFIPRFAEVSVSYTNCYLLKQVFVEGIKNRRRLNN